MSKSQMRRLIKDGAVYVNGNRIRLDSPMQAGKNIIRIGRDFYMIDNISGKNMSVPWVDILIGLKDQQTIFIYGTFSENDIKGKQIEDILGMCLGIKQENEAATTAI